MQSHFYGGPVVSRQANPNILEFIMLGFGKPHPNLRLIEKYSGEVAIYKGGN